MRPPFCVMICDDGFSQPRASHDDDDVIGDARVTRTSDDTRTGKTAQLIRYGKLMNQSTINLLSQDVLRSLLRMVRLHYNTVLMC